MTIRRVVVNTLKYFVERDCFLAQIFLFFLQAFNREARQMRLLPMRWLDQQRVAAEGRLRNGKRETAFGPRYLNREAEKVSVQLPDLHYREFDNARICATSSSVISSDDIALIERIPVKINKNTLFDYSAGQIISHGERHALTLLTKPDHIPCGIFLGGNGSANYFHWLIEILPKVQFLPSLPANLSRYPLLVSEDTMIIPTFRETVEKFAEKLDIKILTKSQTYQVSHLVYIDPPSIIPFNLRKNIPYGLGYSHLSAESIQYVRDVALNQTQTFFPEKAVRPRKVFLSRKKGIRNYNQDEVSQFLAQFGFENVYMEDFSFAEQVSIVQHAQWIVGPTGAAWTNLVFCQEKTKCLCWMAEEYQDFSVYSTIAGIVGVDLLYVQYAANVTSTTDLYTKDYTIDLPLIEEGLNLLENL